MVKRIKDSAFMIACEQLNCVVSAIMSELSLVQFSPFLLTFLGQDLWCDMNGRQESLYSESNWLQIITNDNFLMIIISFACKISIKALSYTIIKQFFQVKSKCKFFYTDNVSNASNGTYYNNNVQRDRIRCVIFGNFIKVNPRTSKYR